MVALKGAEIDKFVARPDPTRPVVLVFGPDAGLVRERAEALVRASVDDPKDPFQLARLDGDDLAGEPTRLVEEANTIPLFGAAAPSGCGPAVVISRPRSRRSSHRRRRTAGW